VRVAGGYTSEADFRRQTGRHFLPTRRPHAKNKCAAVVSIDTFAPLGCDLLSGVLDGCMAPSLVWSDRCPRRNPNIKTSGRGSRSIPKAALDDPRRVGSNTVTHPKRR